MDYLFSLCFVGVIVLIWYFFNKKKIGGKSIEFKDVKYIGGLAVIVKKQRVHIAATKNGIELYNPKSFNSICILPWETITRIDCATSSNSSSHALRTGFAVNSMTNGGSVVSTGLALGVSEALFDKHSLSIYMMDGNFTQEVMFNDLRNEKIKTYLIQSRGKFYSSDSKLSSNQTKQTNDINPTDQLSKLAELKDKGIITDAEFDAKKIDLLNRI